MKITVESSNGVHSTFTEDQWNKVKNDPRYSFTIVRQTKEPEEVAEAKAKNTAFGQAAKADTKTSQEKTTQDKK